MLVQDFIGTDVRRHLQDAVVPYRWSDAVLVVYLNQAIRDIFNRHPESAYVSSVVTTAPSDVVVADVTSATATMPITDPFLSPAMHFVCHRALLEETEEAGNIIKANQHYDLYMREIA
jgi:hypothetical protein